jgi:hypothetical protein
MEHFVGDWLNTTSAVFHVSYSKFQPCGAIIRDTGFVKLMHYIVILLYA